MLNLSHSVMSHNFIFCFIGQEKFEPLFSTIASKET